MSNEVDDLDIELIAALREDARTPNKVLAKRLGVAETTIAARIRQLTEQRVMRVILRRDLYSKGYDLQCFADVFVAGRPVRAVAADLAGLARATAVTITPGSPQILVVFNAVDRADLLAALEGEIGVVDGIERIELHTAVDIRKYQTGYARLDLPP